MDDLRKQQTHLTAEMWKMIERMDHRLVTMRNTLQQAGPGTGTTSMAGVVAETAMELLRLAAEAEGYSDAVRRM